MFKKWIIKYLRVEVAPFWGCSNRCHRQPKKTLPCSHFAVKILGKWLGFIFVVCFESPSKHHAHVTSFTSHQTGRTAIGPGSLLKRRQLYAVGVVYCFAAPLKHQNNDRKSTHSAALFHHEYLFHLPKENTQSLDRSEKRSWREEITIMRRYLCRAYHHTGVSIKGFNEPNQTWTCLFDHFVDRPFQAGILRACMCICALIFFPGPPYFPTKIYVRSLLSSVLRSSRSASRFSLLCHVLRRMR